MVLRKYCDSTHPVYIRAYCVPFKSFNLVFSFLMAKGLKFLAVKTRKILTSTHYLHTRATQLRTYGSQKTINNP
jgi:hypothetical protein